MFITNQNGTRGMGKYISMKVFKRLCAKKLRCDLFLDVLYCCFHSLCWLGWFVKLWEDWPKCVNFAQLASWSSSVWAQMSGSTKAGWKVRWHMNDLISFHCPDTVPIMFFPGNLDNLETIVPAVFRSLSLVFDTKKKVLNAGWEKV